MNTSYIKFLSAFVLLAFASQGASAQEIKIGYVNQDRVVSEASLSKSAAARKTELEKRQKELEDMAARLRANAEKFEKESPTLADAERTRRSRDLVEQDREVQRRNRALQEDGALWKQEEMGNLGERVRRVIKQLSETEKLDLVVGDALFVNPKLDITDKVIKILNAQSLK
jgi:outer membrane protein